MNSRYSLILLGLIPILFMIIFFYFPLASILKDSFSANIIQILFDSNNLKIWRFTFIQAILSTIISLAIGLPAGYLFGRYEFRCKRFLLAFLTVPFVLPGVFVALGVITVLGPNGLIAFVINTIIPENIAFGWIGIMYAHAFYNIPLIIHWTSSSLTQSDPEVEEVAKSLGSKGWHKFKRIILPTMLPGIIVGCLLTFIFCFLSFPVVKILGGINLRTMEVHIASTYKTFPLTGKPIAASLALMQFLVMFVFVYLYMRSLKRVTERKRVGRSAVKKLPNLNETKPLVKTLIVVYFGFLILFNSLLFLGIMNKSLRNQFTNTLTLENYNTIFSFVPSRFLGVGPLRSVFNSFFFAFSSVYIAAVLGLCTLFLREKMKGKSSVLFDTFIFLPLTASAITLALGMVRAFHSTDIFYSDVWFFIIIAHSLISFPFMMRAFANAKDRVDPDLIETSRGLGAKRLETFFRIELPLMLPTILIGLSFTFAMSIGEFTATNFLWEPKATTMSVAIYRFISMRQWGPASAMSVLVGLVCFVSFLIIYKLSEEEMRIF